MAKSTITRTDFSPEETGAMLGMDGDTIRAEIKAGRLSAWDSARPSSTRPRYRVTIQSIEAYRQLRAVRPPAPKTRRPSRAGVTKYI